MDYRCPVCGEDLKNKMLPTKVIGNKEIFGFKYPRLPYCSKCGTAIVNANTEQDKQLLRYILWPVILAIFTLVSNIIWLQFMAGFTFLAGVLYVAYSITRDNYKTRPHYKVYDEKIERR